MPIGPTKKTKTIEYLSCEGCGVLKPVELGGTPKFPLKRMNYYCHHPGLPTQVAYLKHYPQTPPWCRVLDPTNEDDDLTGIEIEIWKPEG